MRRAAALSTLLLSVTTTLAGCGTVMNLRGEGVPSGTPHPFGGVMFDAAAAVVAFPWLTVPALLDLPLSLVADAVTLPVVLGLRPGARPRSPASEPGDPLPGRAAEPEPRDPRPGRDAEPERGDVLDRAEQDRAERARARALRRALSALQHPQAATSPR